MTTLFPTTITCVCCGKSSKVMVIGSTNAFGSMDLDMRPPPMERDTLRYQVQQCADCGYCATTLDSAEGSDTSCVSSLTYKALLEDVDFPELARRFRAQALLADSAGHPALACRLLLRAAWACDDENAANPDAASECRRNALAAMQKAHIAGDTITADRTSDEILSMDLLRRAGAFHGVAEVADRLAESELPELLRGIADFQIQQAKDGNRDCFTVDQALSS